MNYWTYVLVITLLAIIPQIIVRNTYKKYSKIGTSNNKTGERVVKEMLFNSGVMGVGVERINGFLSDHYNSRSKKIRLCNENFESSSIAGIAVAAHETGHAIQDDRGYFFLGLRRAMGPVTIVANKLSWIVLYLGFFLYFEPMILMGIALISFVVLFDVVTLPVEINASKRAKRYLLSTGEYTSEEIEGVSKVLTAAAFTYLAATLAGVLQVIRLIGVFNRRD